MSIVEKLYTGKEFKDITSNVLSRIGRHYSEDLHSEIILRIIESGDDLNEIKSLHYYFFAYAYRTIREYGVAKKYGYNINRKDIPMFEMPEGVAYEFVPEKSVYDKVDEMLQPSLDDTWSDDYKKKLFKLYLQTGNYRDLSSRVKIPYVTVANTIKSFKYELIEKTKDK